MGLKASKPLEGGLAISLAWTDYKGSSNYAIRIRVEGSNPGQSVDIGPIKLGTGDPSWDAMPGFSVRVFGNTLPVDLPAAMVAFLSAVGKPPIITQPVPYPGPKQISMTVVVDGKEQTAQKQWITIPLVTFKYAGAAGAAQTDGILEWNADATQVLHFFDREKNPKWAMYLVISTSLGSGGAAPGFVMSKPRLLLAPQGAVQATAAQLGMQGTYVLDKAATVALVVQTTSPVSSAGLATSTPVAVLELSGDLAWSSSVPETTKSILAKAKMGLKS